MIVTIRTKQIRNRKKILHRNILETDVCILLQENVLERLPEEVRVKTLRIGDKRNKSSNTNKNTVSVSLEMIIITLYSSDSVTGLLSKRSTFSSCLRDNIGRTNNRSVDMKKNRSIKSAVRLNLPELTKPGGETTTRNIMTVDNLLNSIPESENINRERITRSIYNRLSHTNRSRKKTAIQIHFIGSKKEAAIRSERGIERSLHVGLIEIPERRLHDCTLNTRNRSSLTIHTRNSSHKASYLKEEAKSRNGFTSLISRSKNIVTINILTNRGKHRVSNVRNEIGKTNVRRKRKTDIFTIRSKTNACSITTESHKEIVKRTQRNTTITITKDLFSISGKKMFSTIETSKIITSLNNRSNIVAGVLLIVQETNPVSIHIGKKNVEIRLVSKNTLHVTRNRNRTRSIKSFNILVILRSRIPPRAGITNRKSKMIQESTSSNSITKNIRTKGRISPEHSSGGKRLRILSRNVKKVRVRRTKKKRNKNSTKKLLAVDELIR